MNSSSDASSGNVTNTFRLRNLRPLSERKQPPTITELMSIRVDEVRHVQRDGGDSASASVREGHKKSLEEVCALTFLGNKLTLKFRRRGRSLVMI